MGCLHVATEVWGVHKGYLISRQSLVFDGYVEKSDMLWIATRGETIELVKQIMFN